MAATARQPGRSRNAECGTSGGGGGGGKSEADAAAACAARAHAVADHHDHDLDPGLSSYEAERAARIAANAARLAALGIPVAAQAMAPPPPPAAAPRRPRPAQRKAPPPPPTTRSLRPRPAQPPHPPPSAHFFSGGGGRARRPAAPWSPADLDPIPRTVAAPFTSRCGTVTIHSLGRVVHATPDGGGDNDDGNAATAWWSSSGARFRHAYTAGYAATRHRALRGRDFKCEVVVENGEGNPPLFRVTDLVSGRSHTGPSPTRPWTTHCIETGTGVRVSGPLFYGFCEALVQAGLAALVAEAARSEGGGGGGGSRGGGPAPHELRSPVLGSSGGGGGGAPLPRRVRRRAAAA